MMIAISKDEWARITRWTDSHRDEAAALQRRERIRFLEETSREMTKTWPNSLENVNKRNEEIRRARIEAAEQANTEFYQRYVKQKHEEQHRLLHNARDIVFKDRDAPKMLLSAVLETVVQKERQEQVKFNHTLHDRAIQQKKQNDEEIIRKAKEWHELEALKKKKRFEANKQHQKEILEQAHEVAERNRKEHEAELNFQKIDNLKADQQMDAIKKFEEEFKAAEKSRIWSDMERYHQEMRKRQREQAARDDMEEKLQLVLQQSKARVDRRRKQTEEQIKKEKQEVLDKISQKLESGDAQREEKEKAILQKAINEKEAINEARRQDQLKKEARFKQERIETRQKFLKDEENRLRDFNTMRQWEIMNRFKNAELYEDFKNELQAKKARKTQEYKDDILKLWKERVDREAAEVAARREWYGPRAQRRLHDADLALLVHAAHLLAEARAHGRPDYALHRAVDRYCRLHRLHPPPPLPAPLRAHFPHYSPRDRCLIDTAQHTNTAAVAELQGDEKRDGLDTNGMTSASGVQRQLETKDCARVGPASGLQSKKA